MSNFGVPTETQLAKINKLAKRTLSADEVFAFSGKSAGDMMIPNRYTRISKELLQVMVDDAQKGVSFMYNHNWMGFTGLQGVPYGKVFDGKLETSAEANEITEMHLSRYIVRDDEQIEGMSANALIKKIETGVLSDTSISFNTDTMICSICANNYYSRDCSHYRGAKYEMGDGTQKVCTVTAMPPSIIIPCNNNALFEESIVWDGAYPGAMVSQAKDGDIIELPTGNFAVLGEKDELADKTVFINKYSKGNMLTMVKKSDHKKINPVTANLKGGENQMNEKMKKMLGAFGVATEATEETSFDIGKAFEMVAEKYDAHIQAIKDSAAPLMEGLSGVFMTVEQAKEKLGKECTSEQVLNLASEGIEYRKQLTDDALAMGVRAMGNEFTKETWEQTFSTMGTKAIKDIMKTWETQANDAIPAGRKTDPAAGQQKQATAPDEAYQVGR